MNTVCKEHEWVEYDDLLTNKVAIICENCGARKPIDFKIKENLKVISDNDWEDIVLEFENHVIYETPDDYKLFKKWLKENYESPIKR